MKVKDVDKFRDEVFKNVKLLHFSNYVIRHVSKTYFEEDKIKTENKDDRQIRTVNNALSIGEIPEDGNWLFITGREMFIKVDEYGVLFLTKNKEKQRFDYDYRMWYEDYQNRIEFMMEVAIRIAKFAV